MSYINWVLGEDKNHNTWLIKIEQDILEQIKNDHIFPSMHKVEGKIN